MNLKKKLQEGPAATPAPPVKEAQRKDISRVACGKSEAYFANLSPDFPASKWSASGPRGAIW
jgi:hypothetical protein